MAEEKSNTEVKKKVAKKKVAKKKTSKKVVKKAATKKTTARRATKKVLRKKASDKKPIKLKAESSDLDSFAEHAAETVIGIEEAAVSLDTLTTEAQIQDVVDTGDKVDEDKTTMETVKSDETETVVSAETVDTDSNTDTQTSVSQPVKKPKIEVDAYYKNENKASSKTLHDANLANPKSRREGVVSKLMVAVILFAGFGVYIKTIFDQNQGTLPVKSVETAPSIVFKDVSSDYTSKPEQADKKTNENVQESPVVKPVDSPTVTTSGTTSNASQAPVVSQVVNKVEQSKSQYVSVPEANIAQQKSDQSVSIVKASSQAEHFPPPPTPDFLKSGIKKPLPQEQMELIKQTFAPEMFK